MCEFFCSFLSLSFSIYFVGSHLLFFCIIALQAFSSNLPCIRWLIWGWLRLFVSAALVFLFGYLWIWSNQFVYWICAFKCEWISTGSSVFHWKIIARNGPWLKFTQIILNHRAKDQVFSIGILVNERTRFAAIKNTLNALRCLQYKH